MEEEERTDAVFPFASHTSRSHLLKKYVGGAQHQRRIFRILQLTSVKALISHVLRASSLSQSARGASSHVLDI